jgi:hypothetical protein
MPRTKKKELLLDVTPTQPESENRPEGQDQPQELQSAAQELAQPVLEMTTEACPRDFLATSLESATNSVEQLFTKQAELTGSQIADAVFDKFEAAFINRLEERLQPFVDVVLPNIRETQTQLQQGSTMRLKRRQGAFERLKQIASLISDECRLLPPVTAVGEFVTWNEIEPTQQQEND